MKKNMFKIIKKLISFFKWLYNNLYKLIVFNCFVNKQLTYQAEISSSKSNDEFELINQKHNSIVTVSVKDTNKDKAKILYENKRRAQKVMLKTFKHILYGDCYILFLYYTCCRLQMNNT